MEIPVAALPDFGASMPCRHGSSSFSKEILNFGLNSSASATFEVGSRRIFGVMRSAIVENQATFMSYPPINTIYDEKKYFLVTVVVQKKSEPPGPT